MKKISVILIGFSVFLIAIGCLFLYYKQPLAIDEIDSSDKRLTATEYSKYVSAIQQTADYFDSYMSDDYSMVDINAINADKKTLFILKKICNYQIKQVSLEQVTKEAKRYFIEFEPYLDDIEDSTGTVLYRYKNKQYTYVSSEAQLYNFVTKDISSEGYQDHWILKKKGYYVKSTLDDDHYVNTVYATFKDYKNNKNALATYTNTFMALTDEDYAKIQKDLKTITYYFVKKGETYYIESIKVAD